MVDVSSENIVRAVFQTLAYSDVFDYPLTAAETQRYLTSSKSSAEQISRALSDESLFEQTGAYFTLPGRSAIVQKRKQRAEIAARLWPRAWCYGQLIASLPFVRMVAVTGSLSMNNTDAGNDIDLMIVTAPGRLWTARAVSLLIARLAKLEGIRLCPNYLVTTNALELHERSLYVAHELAQMIPISGMDVYHELRRRNAWVDGYLPNASGAPEPPEGLKRTQEYPAVQKLLESLFRLPFVEWFERWEMKRKTARLTREQLSSDESYFSADVCKGHVDRHGKRIVMALAVRLQEGTSPVLKDDVRNAAITETP